MDRHVTLFHSPNSRSAGVRVLLEELQADYDLHVVNFKKKEQHDAAYLAVNPMGKVPAILHGDALVTEQPAVYTFLADLYADRGLAPALDDRPGRAHQTAEDHRGRTHSARTTTTR